MNNKFKYTLFTFGFVVFIFFISFSAYFIDELSRNHIKNVVSKKGGIVLSIETMAIKYGPFLKLGQGNNIYHFLYELDGDKKEGWMRSRFFFNDYILDGSSKQTIKHF